MIGFPLYFATYARSTLHGIAHRISTVLSWEVNEPILETRKIGLQHMLKTKKLKILTEDPPPYPLKGQEPVPLLHKHLGRREMYKTGYDVINERKIIWKYDALLEKERQFWKDSLFIWTSSHHGCLMCVHMASINRIWWCLSQNF